MKKPTPNNENFLHRPKLPKWINNTFRCDIFICWHLLENNLVLWRWLSQFPHTFYTRGIFSTFNKNCWEMKKFQISFGNVAHLNLFNMTLSGAWLALIDRLRCWLLKQVQFSVKTSATLSPTLLHLPPLLSPTLSIFHSLSPHLTLPLHPPKNAIN